jgi:hypothetical protein
MVVNMNSNPIIRYLSDVLGIKQFLADIGTSPSLDNDLGSGPVTLPENLPDKNHSPLVWLIEALSVTPEELALIKRMSEAIQAPEYEVIYTTSDQLVETKKQLVEEQVRELIVVQATGALRPAEVINQTKCLCLYGLSSLLSDPLHKREVWNQMKTLVALRG